MQLKIEILALAYQIQKDDFYNHIYYNNQYAFSVKEGSLWFKITYPAPSDKTGGVFF
nr:hypothetical protein [uncultured Pedobacter sp.]